MGVDHRLARVPSGCWPRVPSVRVQVSVTKDDDEGPLDCRRLRTVSEMVKVCSDAAEKDRRRGFREFVQGKGKWVVHLKRLIQ